MNAKPLARPAPVPFLSSRKNCQFRSFFVIGRIPNRNQIVVAGASRTQDTNLSTYQLHFAFKLKLRVKISNWLNGRSSDTIAEGFCKLPQSFDSDWGGVLIKGGVNCFRRSPNHINGICDGKDRSKMTSYTHCQLP